MTFLEYVADDLLQKHGTNLSRIAVVFPNKRASLFLNEHLARKAGRPLWSPAYITISDLFRQHSTLRVADPIKLVCDLHKSFIEQTGIDETLDHFYGWGQLLLSDFDDLDKNMAPADKVFANVRDIHEFDDTSYLTPEQQAMLRRFFSNFSVEHNSELRQRFLRLWSHIGDIYTSFNQRLLSQQLCYEGALYRQVATDEQLTFDYDEYIFVGFNMLQQVEQTLFRRMKQQGKARFYWDFDHYYLGKNEAGHYIAQYLADFPNELDSRSESIYGQFSEPKQLSFVSAPTEHIQARYISQWLKSLGSPLSPKTAIVLCDERLLQTVVHSLPDEVEKVNITTGYPLNQTSVSSLVGQLIALQTTGYALQTDRYRLRQVNAVLRHPYAKYISPLHQELHSALNKRHIYYPSREQMGRDEGLQLLFAPLSSSNSQEFNIALLRWLMRVLHHIAERAPQEQPSLDAEAIFRMYTLLNRLLDLVESGDLAVDIVTLQRLVAQLVQATTIPFHGEPAEGLQVMGVLETRNLDFDHLLLLSCNEGNMPRGVNDTSFIPYAIRKAYGLTTIDHKVAIYAYYFHRLLQRASHVTILYNNSTNEGQTGEMSRFMLQLMVESRQPIRFATLRASQAPLRRQAPTIQKTPQLMQQLRQRFERRETDVSRPLFTPTAINCYMRCPLRFYYRYAAGLAEPDERDDDAIDNRIFGNIFHLASQLVYERLMATLGGPSAPITQAAIEALLQNDVDIERAVDEAFKRELFQIRDPHQKLPPFDGLQLINRKVIIQYIRQLLKVDSRLAPFTIIGLECDVVMPYQVDVSGFKMSTTLGGRIDRLDMVDGCIRVIDYKTGAKRLKSLPSVDAIFNQQYLRDHNDYYLQAFLYSHIISRQKPQPVAPALLFIQHAGTADYDPTLEIANQPVVDIKSHSAEFIRLLDATIADIFNPTLPFQPTSDLHRCSSCPYRALCGR